MSLIPYAIKKFVYQIINKEKGAPEGIAPLNENTLVPLANIPVIPRTKLEYPTEDVSFAYLCAIGKTRPLYGRQPHRFATVTLDSFTDKAIEVASIDYYNMSAYGRAGNDNTNAYFIYINSQRATSDFVLQKIVAGTETILSTESVDIAVATSHLLKLSCVGSTISAFRNDMTTPKISVTDTDLVSGGFGVGTVNYARFYNLDAMLRSPATQLPPVHRIIEVDITGSGKEEDPIRPNLDQQLDTHPELGDIDKLAVTWGAFDYKGESTMLIVITADNPYKKGAILKQEEHAKAKNLKVFKPPRNLLEAKELNREIKKDRPEKVAGVHCLAYQCIGYKDLEPLAVADFYDGFVQGIYDMKDLERVPEWELERTIKTWMNRLEKSRVSAEEKDKHMKKLNKVIKS